MCRNTFAKQIFHSEAISLVRRTNFIKKATDKSVAFLVEEGGFEPPKRDATDLQSAPFGHSGTPPFMELVNGRSRASRVSTARGTAAPFLSENLPPADFQTKPSQGLSPFPNSWMYKRRKAAAFHFFICGAGERTRTPDLLITNQLLYQLSYTSVKRVPDALGDPSEIRTPDTLIKSQVLCQLS